MRIPVLFTGIFATFALAWFGETVVPQIQLGGLQPQTEEDGSDAYPVNNSGIVARGRKVYVSEGCFYCHTQQVRGEEGGSDIDRGWGKRRTVARDYIYDEPVVLGLMRNGPDLANIGNPDLVDSSTKEKRWKDAAWHYAHLYDPRIAVDLVKNRSNQLSTAEWITGQFATTHGLRTGLRRSTCRIVSLRLRTSTPQRLVARVFAEQICNHFTAFDDGFA